MMLARKYKYLDIIRLFACLAVLLYHFNVLKGGYLAVCSFFVLSGYLSCVSAFRKKFSILSYYYNRLIKIYLPLVIVIFFSIFIISLFPSINWINLKPETTSVLLGYNNFWQLNANLDYFARHVDSPFMHLWYISILLQFDLIFPIVYILFKKIGNKINKAIPCIVTFILAIISFVYFYKLNLEQNMMIAYYNTFSRMFSLLFGLFLGFVHSYYGPLILNKFKNKSISKVMFYMYILILAILFIFIESNSIYFSIIMLAATLITCRLIDYSVGVQEEVSIFDKVIKSLSKVSYEIYLFQYPIIYLFQSVDINNFYKIIIMTILIVVLSCILHFCTNKNYKFKFLKIIMCLVIMFIFLCGEIKYFSSKDYTVEMNQLEQQLADNERIMKEKQEKYETAFKQEEENWLLTLENLENEEAELKNVVSNLQIVGVGDSVMLGAINSLYEKFPNGYFDAKISRTAWMANSILKSLENNNMLGETIVMNLGANGDCPEWCKVEIMETIGDRKVFWVNTTNYKQINNELLSFSKKYNNLYIIDWNSISKGHPEYFIADKIHLTDIGKKAYAETIYNSIYEVYLNEYNEKRKEIMEKHEKESKTKISFYGNDILINAYDCLQTNFYDSSFMTNKDYDFEILKEKIKESIQNNTLNYKVVFAFDSSVKLSEIEYNELIELCLDHDIYILALDETISNLSNKNVKIINFYDEIKSNSDYLMVDGIHLTEKGNAALCEVLNSSINKD